jgi:predicted Fe-Mo cluster-binding NifX family protein
MTRVAIPIFLDRVSPRLDCARRLLILHIEDNRLVEKRELDISPWSGDEKIIQLRQLGIEQVICGGIRLEDKMGLNRFGIQVASPVFGEIDTVIEAFLRGALKGAACPCPGRQRRRRHCFD